jgi:hypothetical protein
VYFFMKDVVVPLSAIGRAGRFAWVGMIGHAFLVGLPIALLARRAQASSRSDVPRG